MTAVARWKRIAGRPVAAVGMVAALALLCILVLAAATGVPEPKYHDESATIVMADIFAHGRLCEPTHPFWQHFETFHVLSRPCYQGKYPPGPALLMALGQRITGYPIAGVWLSVALMIAAVGYAMYAWLPAEWALFGTTLVTLRFGIVGDWPASYWGGAVAAAGGALVIGAAGRLTITPRARDGALLAMGLVSLGMSRPYEGAAYSVVPLALVASRLWQPGPGRARLWHIAMPAAGVVLALSGAWLAYYNWRVTGSASTPPYVSYERAYSSAPLFVLQQPRVPPPAFHNLEMTRFERDFALRGALEAQTHWPWQGLQTLAGLVWSYLQPTMVLGVLGLLLTGRLTRPAAGTGAVRIAALSLTAILAACSLQLWWAPRYLAPMTSSLFMLVAAGSATLSQWRIGRFGGWILVVAIAAGLTTAVVGEGLRAVRASRTSTGWWTAKRDVRERLLQAAGDDLVFVHYAPDHNVHIEWVYNGASIDRQPIVWAREIDQLSDAALREYFHDRRAWVVDADAVVPQLTPWLPAGQTR